MSRLTATGSGAARLRLTRAEGLWLIGALAILAATAYLAERHVPQGAEVTVFRLVNDAPGVFFLPAWTVMQLGSLLAVPVVAAVVAATRRFRLAAGILIGGLAAYYLANLVKHAVHRGRPDTLLPGVHIRGTPAQGLGYVSGHAAVACLLATVLWPYLGPRMRAAVLVLAGVVCVARMYVGAHLPLDVIGGAALGVGVGLAVRLVLSARS